jgi:hypothetical protein
MTRNGNQLGRPSRPVAGFLLINSEADLARFTARAAGRRRDGSRRLAAELN